MPRAAIIGDASKIEAIAARSSETTIHAVIVNFWRLDIPMWSNHAAENICTSSFTCVRRFEAP